MLLTNEAISNGLNVVQFSYGTHVQPFTHVASVTLSIGDENQHDIKGTHGYLVTRTMGAATGTFSAECTGLALDTASVATGGSFVSSTKTANTIEVKATKGTAPTITKSSGTGANALVAGVYAYDGANSLTNLTVLVSKKLSESGRVVTLASVGLSGTISASVAGTITVYGTAAKVAEYVIGGDEKSLEVAVTCGGRILYDNVLRGFVLTIPRLILNRGMELMTSADGSPPTGTVAGSIALAQNESGLAKLSIV